jgi:uncharacterized protein (DUF885 family)
MNPRNELPRSPAAAGGLILTTLALVLTLGAGSFPALGAASDEEADKLAAYFKAYLDTDFQQHPNEATGLGDHRFDDQLDDISATARAGWLAFARQTLADLPKKVDYRRLSRDRQIDFEIFRHQLETGIWLTENTKPFEEDPRTYGDYLSDSVYVLLTQSTLPRDTNVANCVVRMAQFPRIIATAEATLTRPPATILDTAIRQNQGAIAFYQSDIFQLAGDTSQLESLKAAAAKVAAELADYQKFLEGPLRARADGDWRLGPEKFKQKLDLVLEAGMSADDVLADARAEFDRVQRDLYVVSRQLWPAYFPGTNLPPDDADGRRETITKIITAVDKEHGRPEDLVTEARATVAEIKQFIRDRHYLQLPDPDLCQVIEMPEFRRGNSVAYLQNAPPLDPNAHSYYAVSPPPADWTPAQKNSMLEEYNSHMLKILTIHEAYPGHYVQLSLANENPSLIRRVYQSGPFVEGWAVYGETTMLNEGFENGDLRLRLMQLKFYLRTVANAILDHQMHCTQMTDEEAMQFLTRDAYQSEGEAKLKLIRAKQSSTQLSTYFVGRMAHYRLHQQIEREMGGKFDLSRYHEAVLAHGSVPVKYLPELVRTRLNLTQ